MPPRERNFEWKPGPMATAMQLDTQSDVKYLQGPLGSGKTSAGVWQIVDFWSEIVKPMYDPGAKWAREYNYMVRKTRHLVVRETYPQLEQTTMVTFFKWFPPGCLGNNNPSFNSVKKEYVMRILDKEIIVLFRALDGPTAVEDVKSLDLTCAWVDEAPAVRQDVIMHIQGRLGRYPAIGDLPPEEKSSFFITPYQMLLTGNPPNMSHHFYRDFVSERKKGNAFYKSGQDENKHNLPPNYYEKLAVQYGNRPDLIRTLVNGDWGITINGEAVYPEFKYDLHVSKNPIPPNGSLVIRGWDNTGLHPACVVTQFSSTGQWCWLKEFLASDTGIEEFAETVQMWCNQKFGKGQKYRDIADPAGNNRDSKKMSPAMYMRQMGIRLENGIQTPSIRREAIKGRLTKLINRGQPAMLIDPSCAISIEAFEGAYAFKEKGNTGVYDPAPRKDKWADLMDAGQYAATLLFLRSQPDVSETLRALGMKNDGAVKGGWAGR